MYILYKYNTKEIIDCRESVFGYDEQIPGIRCRKVLFKRDIGKLTFKSKEIEEKFNKLFEEENKK